MSKSKFNLFSRSALTSMAAAAGIVVPAADDGRDDDENDNPEAGPKPEDAPAAAPASDGAEAAPADPAAADTDAGIDVVAVADAAAHAQDSYAAGVTAERQRTAAVFASAAGLANPAMAAFMLAESNASADAIVSKLGALPAAPAAGAVTIPDTNVDLGKPGAAAAAVAEGGDGEDVWAQVQGKNAAPVVSSDAGRMTLAALQAGARTVNAAPTPSTPAVAPTGN